MLDYLEYWALRRKPFLAGADVLFFAGASHREAMAGLSYFMASGQSVARLVAPPRCGMTHLLRHVHGMQGFGDIAVETVYTDGHQLQADRLSGELLNKLGLASAEADSDSRLRETLQSSGDQGVRILWLIDRCKPETATSIGAWAESLPRLSVMTGITRTAGSGIQVFRKSEYLKVDLDPLSLEDTFEYLRYCLGQAGGRSSLFSDAAAVRLHEISGGAVADLAVAAEESLKLAALHGFNYVVPVVVEAAAQQRRAA